MLYAIFCYDREDVVGAWSKEEDDAVIGRLIAVQDSLAAKGKIGPVARLLPTTAATTICRRSRAEAPTMPAPRRRACRRVMARSRP